MIHLTLIRQDYEFLEVADINPEQMYTKAGIPLRGPRAGSRDVPLHIGCGSGSGFPNYNALVLALHPWGM